MTEGGEPLSQRQLREFIGRYAIWGEGSAVFHLESDLDWRELLAWRRRQLAYVGRYGRQSIEEWQQKPVTQLTELVAQLTKIVREENGPGEDL